MRKAGKQESSAPPAPPALRVGQWERERIVVPEEEEEIRGQVLCCFGGLKALSLSKRRPSLFSPCFPFPRLPSNQRQCGKSLAFGDRWRPFRPRGFSPRHRAKSPVLCAIGLSAQVGSEVGASRKSREPGCAMKLAHASTAGTSVSRRYYCDIFAL